MKYIRPEFEIIEFEEEILTLEDGGSMGPEMGGDPFGGFSVSDPTAIDEGTGL